MNTLRTGYLSLDYRQSQNYSRSPSGSTERTEKLADTSRRPFRAGKHVFLKISPTKRVIRFGTRGTDLRYIGPFEILDHVGDITY